MKYRMKEQFVPIPVKVYEVLKEYPSSRVVLFIAIWLGWSKENGKIKKGWYYRSIRELMKDSGLASATVQDSFKVLVEKKLINVIKDANPYENNQAHWIQPSTEFWEEIEVKTTENNSVSKIDTPPVSKIDTNIKSNEIRLNSIPENNASSIPGLKRKKSFSSLNFEKENHSDGSDAILYEDTPRIWFTNLVEERFSKLDENHTGQTITEILGDLFQQGKDITGAKDIVEDYINSTGDKFDWGEDYRHQLLEELFPNADA